MKLTMTEDLAVELRWLEHRDALYLTRSTSNRLTRIQVWERCSRTLQDSYRADARHLLRVIEKHRRPRTSP